MTLGVLVDVVLGLFVISLFLAAFLWAGTSDYESELAYREAWSEANGIKD